MTFKRLTLKNIPSELKEYNNIEEIKKIVANDESAVFAFWSSKVLVAVTGIKYLDFDSLHFGFKVGKYIEFAFFENPAFSKKDILSFVLSEASQGGFSHITAKCASENFSYSTCFEDSGFFLVVCNLILSHRIIGKEDYGQFKLTRIAKYDDLCLLKSIALRSFSSKTRFHFDPHFPENKSTELHSIWIENLLKNEDARVLCAEVDSKIVGFITCQILDHSDISDERIGYIDLIAVDNNYRGRGIGSVLVKAALCYLKDKVQNVMVDTESINYPALYLYQKNGFFISGSRFVFHKWLG